jgi:hypothetical protein
LLCLLFSLCQHIQCWCVVCCRVTPQRRPVSRRRLRSSPRWAGSARSRHLRWAPLRPRPPLRARRRRVPRRAWLRWAARLALHCALHRLARTEWRTWLSQVCRLEPDPAARGRQAVSSHTRPRCRQPRPHPALASAPHRSRSWCR